MAKLSADEYFLCVAGIFLWLWFFLSWLLYSTSYQWSMPINKDKLVKGKLQTLHYFANRIFPKIIISEK